MALQSSSCARLREREKENIIGTINADNATTFAAIYYNFLLFANLCMHTGYISSVFAIAHIPNPQEAISRHEEIRQIAGTENSLPSTSLKT